MTVKSGGLREAGMLIRKELMKHESFLRLLVYKPMDADNPSPLDPSLPNIIGNEKMIERIMEKHLLLGEKLSDLEDTAIVRVFISFGRRRPKDNNYLIAGQEIYLHVYTHENYNMDMRNAWITDEINSILTHKHGLAGIGKLEFAGAEPFTTIKQYQYYRTRFLYTSGAK